MDALLPADLIVMGVPDWAGRLIGIVIVIAAAAICLAVTRWVERRSVTHVTTGVEPGAARQRSTAVSALATGVRYLVVLGAIIAIVALVFGVDSVATISGSAFVILVLGFAAQRLLTDMVAGFFILFENQYAVGDLVRLDSTLPIGIVERVSLRTTVVRTISGDHVFVPNSQIKYAERMSHAMRDMEVGVLVTDVSGVQRAVADAADVVGPGGVRFGTPPVITRTDDMGDGLAWVRIRVDVPPGFEWLATQVLVDLVRARCGGALVGEPVASDANRAITSAYTQTLRPR